VRRDMLVRSVPGYRSAVTKDSGNRGNTPMLNVGGGSQAAQAEGLFCPQTVPPPGGINAAGSNTRRVRIAQTSERGARTTSRLSGSGGRWRSDRTTVPRTASHPGA
jgi:hypothetical protein